ncbi:MAG: hypothetical protein KDC34_02565 [Saprospiraceae bacterium]|nr:hypothetical protein [Saprospiraceae bacterium]
MIRTFMTSCLLLIMFVVSDAQSVINAQLDRVAEILKYDGYSLTHDLEYASLNDGQSDYYSITLRKGYDYKIVAVCDADCGDMDLKIYDENGNLIDSDAESDDTPIVSIIPKWTGEYELWVKMYDCNINPCRFGIAVFGK